MSQPLLADLVVAETRKLFGRFMVRASLSLLVSVGLVLPFLLLGITMMIDTSGEAAAAGANTEPFEAATALKALLGIRNYLLFRAMLIAVVAVSVAGEFVSRTLREDLLRPVSRLQVLTAKLAALEVFVAASVVLPALCCLAASVLIFGWTGDITENLTRWGLSWAGDAGFCVLVVALAFAIRSVPGTLLGVFVYYLVDRALGFVLWGLEKARPMLEGAIEKLGLQDLATLLDNLEAVRPWLPSSAFSLDWDYTAATGVPLQSIVALLLYTALSYGAAAVVFERIDVD